MKKLLPLILLLFIAARVKAQQAPTVPGDEPFGKIDAADLAMKACDFEKDANAEILIDEGDLFYDNKFNITINYHKRIKIYNDNGKDAANIHIPFSTGLKEYISGLQAETVNLTDGKTEITRLDKKQIFTQVIDKYRSEMVFTMPNVKPGSIIEYKYILNTSDYANIPTWYFQNHHYPVRYSELFTHIPEYFYFSLKSNNFNTIITTPTSRESGTIGSGQDIITYTVEGEKHTMVNLPSLTDEPYMSSVSDNLRSLTFHLTSFRPPLGFVENYSNTWGKVGGILVDDEDFGDQLKRKLKNEEDIIAAAKALKTNDEKIAYIFNTVKNTMKWDNDDRWYTISGTSEAWDKKTGNSTEINLIMYHLLKKAGINAMPMVVSTRDNGRVNPTYTSLSQFNRAVVYIPVDSTKKYILDAANKYNVYNEIPYNLLNSSGLYVNMDKKSYDLIFIENAAPSRQSVYISAEIKPNGKLEGTALISSFSYNRVDDVAKYKTDGEEKFIKYLADNDNNLKISSLKIDNMDIDTLPLVQNVKFDLDLSASDDNYIYVNPNIFSSLHNNPFLSESRTTDIDFGSVNNLTLIGLYKTPTGYKIDALPKNISMTMPDKSMTFKRIVGEQDGSIVVHYTINYKKAIYFKEDYPEFREFFKKMYEMMNEQIILKKS